MEPRKRHRPSEYEAGKNSFSASSAPESTAQNRRAIKSAIDESLSAVRFNAQDARSVISAVRNSKKTRPAKKRKSRLRPDLVFTCALFVMLALPLSLYALRSGERITTITVSPGQPAAQPGETDSVPLSTAIPQPTAEPTAAPTPVPLLTGSAEEETSGLLSESEALRIARACFEAQCDTSIFTFEEYTVSAALQQDGSPQYTVTMECIYQNGCTFSIILDAVSGDILQYSAPKLATTPAFVDSASPEVRAWFDEYGEHLFTWPQDIQAEFSRRYQGGTLRAAREDEITPEAAISAVSAPIIEKAPGLFTAFYPVLYSERSSSTGRAFYLVYCFADSEESTLSAGTPMTVSFDAVTGDILSIENNPLDLSLDAILR